MIKALARKTSTGDLYLCMAKQHLGNHEWGLALQAVDRALTKGSLSDVTEAQSLMHSIASLLGITPPEPSAAQNPGFGVDH
jgi:hypothetical protein